MTAALSSLDDLEAKFEEPWQARVFAMVRLLVDGGILTASDWSNCLGSKRAVDSAVDNGYWQDWIETIEEILHRREVLTSDHVHAAIDAITEAREHRHAPSPEPLLIDPARGGHAI